jgi:pSer/pThr/pTyr-binding forkhead associated (FHA) protein
MDKIHLRIGGKPDNDLVVESDGVDDYHLEFFCDNEGNVFVTDLNTKNGTFINGEELIGYSLLSQGDKVILGRHYVFRWEQFVRQNSEKLGRGNLQQSLNEQKNETNFKTVKKIKSVDLSVSNKELLFVYGAILIVLILLYLIF